MKLPAVWAGMSSKQKQAWYKDWYEKNKARPDICNGEGESHELRTDEQGRFLVGVALPGLYRAKLRVFEKGAAKEEIEEEVGRGFDLVVVPEGAGGWNPAALEAGVLKTEDISVRRKGEAAPETTFEKPDGSKGALADYRGKVVIMDIWATLCGPCLAAVPGLKLLHEHYADNANVVMLSLSPDDEKGAWKDYLAKEKLPWS
jgi:hypothetical protein